MIFTEAITEYLESALPERPEVMQEMEAYARENGFPIIGPQVGRLLYQLAKITNARRVVEFGSGFGYSAYWFAMAMGTEGSIIMTDGNPANQKRATDYHTRAGLPSSLEFRVGDALERTADIKGPIDIVLNDIDKEGYPATIEPAAQMLRPGGLFITDNLLWSGQVCDEHPDATTSAILDFTRKLFADDRFFTSLIPIRDGITIAMLK